MRNVRLDLANKKVNTVISSNLKKLWEMNGITQSELCRKISDILGFAVDRSTVNKYMNATQRKNENLSWDAGDCRRTIRFGL